MSDKQYRLRFVKVVINEKHLYKEANPSRPTDFNFQLFATTKTSREEKGLAIFVDVVIMGKSPDQVYARMEIVSVFYLENYEEIITKDEADLERVPIELDGLLRTMAISTARGVIFSELRGTYLDGALLPIILADQLKQVDLTEEKKSLVL